MSERERERWREIERERERAREKRREISSFRYCIEMKYGPDSLNTPCIRMTNQEH